MLCVAGQVSVTCQGGMDAKGTKTVNAHKLDLKNVREIFLPTRKNVTQVCSLNQSMYLFEKNRIKDTDLKRNNIRKPREFQEVRRKRSETEGTPAPKLTSCYKATAE